jgi:hypothetical protein
MDLRLVSLVHILLVKEQKDMDQRLEALLIFTRTEVMKKQIISLVEKYLRLVIKKVFLLLMIRREKLVEDRMSLIILKGLNLLRRRQKLLLVE